MVPADIGTSLSPCVSGRGEGGLVSPGASRLVTPPVTICDRGRVGVNQGTTPSRMRGDDLSFDLGLQFSSRSRPGGLAPVAQERASRRFSARVSLGAYESR